MSGQFFEAEATAGCLCPVFGKWAATLLLIELWTELCGSAVPDIFRFLHVWFFWGSLPFKCSLCDYHIWGGEDNFLKTQGLSFLGKDDWDHFLLFAEATSRLRTPTIRIAWLATATNRTTIYEVQGKTKKRHSIFMKRKKIEKTERVRVFCL